MSKLPISLIIDDPAPRVFVYYEHSDVRETADGRPLVSEVPNTFVRAFADTIHRFGIRGKYSVVPMPGCRGDIVNGIPGFPQSEIEEWLDIIRSRVAGPFSIGPEMLTHHKAVDLENGGYLPLREDEWASDKSAEELTPYIARALTLLKQADLPASGVTSPWYFGIEREKEYIKAISNAFDQVFGKKDAWYFLRPMRGMPDARPWVARNEGGHRLVSIPAATPDVFWQTMNTTDTSEEYVSSIADLHLTKDGKQGEILKVMERGGWPILIAHWQSLFANGLGTGLRVLAEVADRVEKNLGNEVEWMSFTEIMDKVLAEPEKYPIPACFAAEMR